MEALEGLNAITGSRKVGVISHVERLRERIRTHIEVARNGHDPSEVKVVVRGAGDAAHRHYCSNSKINVSFVIK